MDLETNMNILLYGNLFVDKDRIIMGYKQRSYRHSHIVWHVHNPDTVLHTYEQIHHDDFIPVNDNIKNLIKLEATEHRKLHKYIKEQGFSVNGAAAEQALAIKKYLKEKSLKKKEVKNNLIYSTYDIMPKTIIDVLDYYLELYKKNGKLLTLEPDKDLLIAVKKKFHDFDKHIDILFNENNYKRLFYDLKADLN